MSANRILKLQGQGEVQFFELPANGTAKVSMKAPAALAADVAITLPDALPVGTEVLTMSATGVLAYGGGAGAASLPILGGTMQGAIDMGGFALTNLPAGVGNSAARQTELDALATLRTATQADLDTLEATVAALDVTPTLQDAYDGGEDVILTTGNTILFTQPLNEAAFKILKSGTGAGTVFEVENDGTGIGVRVQQDGTGKAVEINRVATGVTGNVCIQIADATNDPAVRIDKTGADGSALVLVSSNGDRTLNVEQSGSGNAGRFSTVAGGADTLLIVNGSTTLHIATNAGGTLSTTGAKLTNAGVWTDGTCFAHTKRDITPVADEGGWLDNLDKLKLVRWTGDRAPQESPMLSPLQDELVTFFGFDPERGTSGREIATVALVCLRALHERFKAALLRITALEAVRP